VAQRRHQPRRILGCIIGHHVVAGTVVNAGVDMHAAAGDVGKGLGHEGGAKAMTARHTVDDAPQQQGVVAGDYRVVLVVGIDFPLPGGEFAVHRRQRYTLDLAGRADVIEELVAVEEIVGHAVLNAVLRFDVPGMRPVSGMRPLPIAVGEQVELQLRGHDRGPAAVRGSDPARAAEGCGDRSSRHARHSLNTSSCMQ
jgi:hypothetical protein